MSPGLYGDLPQAKNSNSDAGAWSAVPKLQPQLRKPAVLTPPPSVLRAAAGRGAGRGGGRGGPGPVAPAAAVAAPEAPAPTQPSVAPSSGIFPSVNDEYDPMRPNDYEEAEAAVAAQFAPPPSLNISGDEAFARRARAGAPSSLPPDAVADSAEPGSGGLGLGAGAAAAAAPPPPPGPPAAGAAEGTGKGMSLAQKMLMKMGWKEGEGLGRERQGMSTPLVMQKTNARAGVIVNAEPSAQPADKKQRAAGAVIVGKPSKVLCLRNMGRATGQPRVEWGWCAAPQAFSSTACPGWPFERVESATKAMVDLQGRYFAGRNVRVAFFDENRFLATDLAPKAAEFDS
ncbi:uncharacterized protein HaLaN_10666 [Haematococcus lacustris]|uniref:G-patch domain-containing protein n=1 Tax=Haematococcus lacustris TaxID=44745 RepID=A0A699YY69_HAELA|nr:uncharacterized protein HaLaN_10666 [Haematococcus lacustris]